MPLSGFPVHHSVRKRERMASRTTRRMRLPNEMTTVRMLSSRNIFCSLVLVGESHEVRGSEGATFQTSFRVERGRWSLAGWEEGQTDVAVTTPGGIKRQHLTPEEHGTEQRPRPSSLPSNTHVISPSDETVPTVRRIPCLFLQIYAMAPIVTRFLTL